MPVTFFMVVDLSDDFEMMVCSAKPEQNAAAISKKIIDVCFIRSLVYSIMFHALCLSTRCLFIFSLFITGIYLLLAQI